MNKQCPVFLPDATLCNQPVSYRGLCDLHAKHFKRGNGIGFNMIVKNEENCLEKTLKNIRGIADEIVITDTGSSDRTVEIALEYADLVLFHEWQQDFSEARNWGLQYATQNFIGWIDADEWINDPDQIPAIIEYCDKARMMTIICAMLSELPGGRMGKHYLPKFFRYRTAHFEQPVHNQLIHSQPVHVSEIEFGHSGYNESPVIMRKKYKRSIGILRKQLKENPDNTFAMMNLTRLLRRENEIDECREMINRALKLETENSVIRQTLLMNKIFLCIDEDDPEIPDMLHEGLSLNPHNTDFLFMLAHWEFVKGNWIDTIIALRAYQMEKANKDTAVHRINLLLDFWDVGILENKMLGTALFALKQYEQARQEFAVVLRTEKNNAHIWRDYLKCCNETGDEESAIAGYFAAVENGIRIQ